MSSIVHQVLLSALLIAAAKGWFFMAKPQGTGWNKLSVTWGKFSGLPTKVSDAQKNNWQKTAPSDSNSYFHGNRYVLGDDKSVMLLFDSTGQIAGIQFGIQKSKAHHDSYNKSYWIPDGDVMVITAYFVHPSVICKGGRKKSSYIGEDLYIQSGPSVEDLMKIPFKESDLASTKWVKGKCFYSMGQHYWYNISTNMKCEDFFPVFLLYNSGKLTGFGWAVEADIKSSRVEHPTPDKFHYFFQPETRPLCLNTAGVLTTQHVFLKKYPYFSFC